MKKKAVSLLLTGIMLGTLLTGCSGGNDAQDASDTGNAGTESGTESEAPEEEEKSDGGVVEVTFWDQNADATRTEIYNKLIADFEADNPDIKINMVPVPADQAKSKYDVAIQSNTAPDCGGVNQSWITDFLMQDALVALDDYIADWDGKDDTLEEYDKSVREMSSDGQMYGLPFTVTLPAIWYNTELLDATGMEVPETWDEVFEAAGKMTDKDKGTYGFSIRGGAGSSQQVEQMMYMYSGIEDMFDEDGKSTANDPAHVEFLEKFASIYNKYTAESDVTNGYTEMVSAFDSGSAGMIFHNLGSYGQHRDTLGEGKFGGIVSVTAENGAKAIINGGAVNLCVFKDSKHPEEAFRFISYLVGHEACSYMNEQIGQIPCNKEALNDPWIQDATPIKEAADALLDPETTVTTLPFDISGFYDLHENTLAEGFQNVLLGNMTAQEYLDNWADEMTKLKADYDAYISSK